MPNTTQPLMIGHGPLIAVSLGIIAPRAEARRAAGAAFLPPLLTQALLDTGASRTLIDISAVERLDLEPTGSARLASATTGEALETRLTYEVALSWANPEVRPIASVLQVIATRTQHCGGLVILGRDVLSRCVIVYNGPQSQFILSY